jgi:NAD(P)-dependent dehydrogenase (short-subunit alcohol dehydrogenase family)
MTTYLVTGGTGFLGRNLLARLARRPDARVRVLVRPSSVGRLEALAAGLDGGERVEPLVGDIRADQLGLSDQTIAELRGQVDHVVHLAALYDMTADAADNEDINIGGTRRVVDVAGRIDAGALHHVSSVAVAGEHRGEFTEDMFDEGQELPSPYHRTKFVAEQVVREESTVPWRVYRPVIVVGDSRTGEMDKIDGPYYFLPVLTSIAELPGARRMPLVLPDLGDTNVVPVDYVADAMDALIHADGLNYTAFHLGHPRMQPLLDVYNALAEAAGAPQVALGLSRRLLAPTMGALSLAGRLPGVGTAAELTAARLGIPPSVLPHSTFRPVFSTARTRAVLDRLGVAPPPEFDTYAQTLYDYWAAHLDPLRARRRRGGGGELQGRTVIVTGASSGIGRETALRIAARGGVPLLVARRTEELEKVREEIERAGGRASVYSVDLTSAESVDAAVKQMLADHDAIDMLVNNAGRSIRRSIALSYDRFHDFERTMALNYFAPVRLVLRLLPHMTERRFGHIVNVSSIGVQANPPRFSAYVASKAALDAFSRVVATEVVGDGVTFTNIHMPLVRTPMIAPTTIYDRFPTLAPDQAAAMIVEALENKPKHIGTRLGTVAVVATALAPKLVDAVLHTAYLMFPDSTAAGGDAKRRTDAPEALSRGAVVLSRLLPGVHW